MQASPTWLRSPRFDVWLQLGALLAIAPALLVYATLDAARASAVLPLASLITIPFLHVFGSFLFAFSAERNRSAWSPRRLALQWAAWGAAALVLSVVAPRALASFALVYGGWHIFRQNYGFLREVAHRAGHGGDPALRRLDLAASAAPAVALWLFVAARGPWRFVIADVYRLPVPAWLLALAFAAVPATVILRERRLAGAGATRAGLLLLAGNAAALLVPALVLDDLMLIYTLSASYHGVQYLAYLAERERERRPTEDPTRALLPLASTITLATIGWFVVVSLVGWLAPAERAQQALMVAWYVLVPFHYFVDGRIWRRRP